MDNTNNIIPVNNCVILNLDSRTDLWDSLENFRDLWKNQNKIVERIPGVDYRKQTHTINNLLKSNILNLNGSGFRHTKDALLGEFGCFMGHYNCWKYIVNNKIDCCLILEDGITILRDDLHKISINKTLDILFINEEMKMDGYKKLIGYGTQGYIVTQKGAQKLMQKCYVLSMPIDLQIRNLCNTNEFIYSVINKPYLKRDNNRTSSIDFIKLNVQTNLNDKQNQYSIIQRLFYNLLEKNVNLDEFI